MLRKTAALWLVGILAISIACDSAESPTSTTQPTATPSITTRFPTATLAPPTPTASPVPTLELSPLAAMLATPHADRDPGEFARLLLSYVPDTEASRKGFWIADYAHAADLLGITLADPSDDSAVDSYVVDVRRGSLIVEGKFLAAFAWDNETRRRRQDARPYVGFAQGDISVGITIGTDDRALEIVFGEIDPELVSQLISACGDCPESETVNHANREFFAWGRDFEKSFVNRYAPPLFDGSGTGGRLAVDQNIAWRAAYTEGMENLLDAAAGEAASMADSADYVGLLELMLTRDAVSVFLSSETVGKDDPDDAFANALFPGFSGLTNDQKDSIREGVTGGNFPPPFSAYSVASAYDEEGFHTLIGYSYPSETSAQASLQGMISRFEQIRTIFSEETYENAFGGVEYSVSGRFVLVRLNLNSAAAIVSNSEPIFLHE